MSEQKTETSKITKQTPLFAEFFQITTQLFRLPVGKLFAQAEEESTAASHTLSDAR